MHFVSWQIEFNATPSSGSFKKMMDSVKKPFPECVDYLVENIKLDPGFNDYLEWALANNIPTVVVSSGMEPIIRAILKNLCGENHKYIEIVSNDVKARPGKTIDQEGGWEIEYHDERSVASLPKEYMKKLMAM